MEYNEKDDNDDSVGALEDDFALPQELDKKASIQRNIKSKTAPKEIRRKRPPAADHVHSIGVFSEWQDFDNDHFFLDGFCDPTEDLIEIPERAATSSKTSNRSRPIRTRNAMSGGSKRSLLQLQQVYNVDFPQYPSPNDINNRQTYRSPPSSSENTSRRAQVLMQRSYEPVDFSCIKAGVLPSLNRPPVTQEICLGKLFGSDINDTKEVRKIVFERLRVLWTLSSSSHKKSNHDSNSHQSEPKTRSHFECTMLLMRLCKATGFSYKDYTKKIRQQLNWYGDVNFDSFCELLIRGTIGPAFSRVGKDQTLDIFLQTLEEIINEVVIVFHLSDNLVDKRLKDVRDIHCVLRSITPPSSLSAPEVTITGTGAMEETLADISNENTSIEPLEKESLEVPVETFCSSFLDSIVQTMLPKSSSVSLQQSSETFQESVALAHTKEKQPTSYETTRKQGCENTRMEEARAAYEASIKNKLLLRKYAHPSRLNGSKDSLAEHQKQVDLSLEGKPLDHFQGTTISYSPEKHQFEGGKTGPRPSSPYRQEADDALPVNSDPNERVLVCGSCRENEAILWCSLCFSVYCSSCWGSSHGTTVDFTIIKHQFVSNADNSRNCGTADILAPKSRPIRQQMTDGPPVAIIYLPIKQPPSNSHILTARSGQKMAILSHSISSPTIPALQVISQPLALPPLKQTHSLQHQKASFENSSSSELLKSLLKATVHPRSLQPRTYKDPKHQSPLIPKVAEINLLT